MLAVESILSISFCAVPDFSRVEPVNTSGPTTGEIAMSACLAISESALQLRAIHVALMDLAYLSAPITYGAVSYTHLRAPRDRTRSRMPSSA